MFNMYSQPQNRWQAFALHIGISAVIFIVLAAIIIFVWYPGFLFQTDGGWQGIRLIAGVDFIIGPVLTLIVYKVGKPRLKMDLTLIGLLQIGCLAYGSWLVYEQRPLAVVYADERFYVMSKGTFDINDINLADIPIIDDGKKPVWLFVDLPEEKAARSNMRMSQITEGAVHLRTAAYLPYQDNVKRVAKLGFTAQEITEHSRFITKNSDDAVRYYPLASRYSAGLLGIDTRDGSVVDLVRKKRPLEDAEPEPQKAREDNQQQKEAS